MMNRIPRSRFLFLALAVGSSSVLLHDPTARASKANRHVIRLHMTGLSMFPTLQNGELLMVDLNAYRHAGPRRRDIVVFRSPLFGPRMPDLIKRVVGLPGEVVRIHAGNVYIDGRKLSERYVLTRAMYTYPPHRIPAGSYFLLGDNRNNSEDSHLLGPIPRREIVGKVLGH